MDEDQWIYDNIIHEEVNMNEKNGEKLGVFKNIDCYDVFNTFQVFDKIFLFVKVSKWMSLED